MRFGLSRYFSCFFSTWRSIYTSTATFLAYCRDADEKKNVSRLGHFCALGLIPFLLMALPDIAFGNQSGRTERHVPHVFQIQAEGLVTIAPEYLEFLEGVDHTASFDSLEQAVWGKNLINDQSLVDGYWVRFRVANTLASEDIGIEHNFNTEKKIFAAHSRGVDEYPYWKQREGDWIDEGRVLGHYRVLMPAGEITTVYDYFRNKPFDRYMSKVNGLDRMTIGPWRDIRSLQLLSLIHI